MKIKQKQILLIMFGFLGREDSDRLTFPVNGRGQRERECGDFAMSLLRIEEVDEKSVFVGLIGKIFSDYFRVA